MYVLFMQCLPMCKPLSTFTLYLNYIYYIQLVMNSKCKQFDIEWITGLNVDIYSRLLCFDRMLFLQLFGDIKSFYKRSFDDYIQREIPSITPRDVESLKEVLYILMFMFVLKIHFFVFLYSQYLIIWSNCILMLVLHNDFVSSAGIFHIWREW